jgi:hypothetical protein
VAGAAVELLDLGVGQLVDELADVRALALQRRDPPLVRDHDDAILGHARVELEGGDADLERLAERGQRVLGPQPAGAAMAFEVEGARGGRVGAHAQHGERREHDGGTPGACEHEVLLVAVGETRAILGRHTRAAGYHAVSDA